MLSPQSSYFNFLQPPFEKVLHFNFNDEDKLAKHFLFKTRQYVDVWYNEAQDRKNLKGDGNEEAYFD